MSIKFKAFLAFFRVFSFFMPQKSRLVLSAIWHVYSDFAKIDVVAAKKFILESTASWWYAGKHNGQKDKSFDPQKKSDTIFLLGSGPSINELTDQKLACIRQHDSWGFNFWFAHDFVPDAMFFQAVPSNAAVDELMRYFLEVKAADYQDSFFWVRGDAVNKGVFGNLASGKALGEMSLSKSYLSEAFVISGSSIPPEIMIESLAQNGFYNAARDFPVPKFGSTICMMVSYAIRQGYRKIVLCGIDMNDTGHFYDREDYKLRYPGLEAVRIAAGDGQHPHTISKKRPYSVKQYLLALKDYAHHTAGAEIFVSSPTSSLYPDFELFEFDK